MTTVKPYRKPRVCRVTYPALNNAKFWRVSPRPLHPSAFEADLWKKAHKQIAKINSQAG